MKVKQQATYHSVPAQRERLRIAFFDYPDVFEDFYPHYGVTQEQFATSWHNTANHTRLKIVQEEIGDVTWYALCLKPTFKKEVKHEYVGCSVKFISSSWLHRLLWKKFYSNNKSWKWRNRWYHTYATIASYLAILSWPLIKELRNNKPDVIFSQDYCSGRFDALHFLAWWFRIPIVAVHTGSTGKYLGQRMKQFTIPKTNWIFISGKKEGEHLEKKYHLSQARMSIVRSPINTSIYKIIPREEACLSANLDADKRYILFIGRLEDGVKRVSSIIKVFQKLSTQFDDLHLLIVGSGKDEKKLKSRAEEQASDKIHFLGWIENDNQKVQLLNIAECLVLASKREGFPTVVGEALACGLPVVASDVGAISDLIINDKTGWLFAPEDDEAMQNCLSSVVENPEMIRDMRPSIRAFAKEHISIEALSGSLKLGFSSLKLKSRV